MTTVNESPVKKNSFMPDDLPLLISAFAAAYGVGWLSLLGLPFLVGSAIESLNIDEAQSGLLVTVEFFGIMVASLGIAPLMGRLDRRRLAVAGAVIALCANAVSALTTSYDLLMIIRPIAGLGAGIAMACGNATVSNSSYPEKFAGQMSVLAVVLMVVIMLGFSRLSEAWGLQGVYSGMAVIIFCMIFGFVRLPSYYKHVKHDFALPKSSDGLKGVVGLLMLGAFFAFSLRDTMAWAFVERIGVEVGYTVEEIGNLLSFQAMLGISGPLIASVVGSKYGIRAPLIIGILSSGLVTFVITQSSESQLLYTIAITFQPATYFFTLAYLTALASELDDKGRIVAASGGALMAGVAAGPLIAGELIVAAGGYSGVSWMIAVCVGATLLFAMSPILKIESTTKAEGL